AIGHCVAPCAARAVVQPQCRARPRHNARVFARRVAAQELRVAAQATHVAAQATPRESRNRCTAVRRDSQGLHRREQNSCRTRGADFAQRAAMRSNLSLAVLLLALAIGCGKKQSEAPVADQETTQRAVAAATEEAQTTFKTVCATCHGAAGLGNGPGAATLNP